MIGPFDYHLPPELIAQQPVEPRDHSRLLTLGRDSGEIAHHRFFELPDLLRPGDLLILNDTRVVPARLRGRRQKTGGRWEGLFLRVLPDGSWEMLCQTGGRPAPGETINVDGSFQLRLEEKWDSGRWRVRPVDPGDAFAQLERHGETPLPPYIRAGTASETDRSRYQTIFAKEPGAVAAPTAGLHFTPELFERLSQRNIESAFVTLHVGVGTFQPIKTDVSSHVMHREWGSIGAAAVAAIERCRRRGGRTIAVGTTSVRVLETAALSGSLGPWTGETSLFIHPPFSFRVVGGLITNFHLPRTTLLLLAAAFAGADNVRRAYETAVAERYRFYSYGDAMLIT